MPKAPDAPRAGFTTRGGWWVLAQVPVLTGAALIPWWLGGGWPDADRAAAWMGGLLILGGVAISILSLVQLGDALTPYPYPRAGAGLRRHGIYRWMRHPIYSGLMLASLGWALAWTSVAGMIYFFVVAGFFDRKAAREERWLSEHYAEYAAYRRQTRKFIPGLY